jgi:hypothetical protein
MRVAVEGLIAASPARSPIRAASRSASARTSAYWEKVRPSSAKRVVAPRARRIAWARASNASRNASALVPPPRSSIMRIS